MITEELASHSLKSTAHKAIWYLHDESLIWDVGVQVMFFEESLWKILKSSREGGVIDFHFMSF